MESTDPNRNGWTPQVMASWRRTRSVVVNAAMVQPGRKREITRAEFPDCVATRMAFASRSSAVVQQLWLMASLMGRSARLENPIFWNLPQ